MITSIELGDFLSHSETKLEFGNGVTIFVGQNGAGKSSIIDAITFALFGQHTRKSNRGLIKIASILQQGELNAIIKAKPKEFKELLNAIIGIDKLDVASEAMKTVNKNFREKIREEIGYDDTHINILLRDFKK